MKPGCIRTNEGVKHGLLCEAACWTNADEEIAAARLAETLRVNATREGYERLVAWGWVQEGEAPGTRDFCGGYACDASPCQLVEFSPGAWNMQHGPQCDGKTTCTARGAELAYRQEIEV